MTRLRRWIETIEAAFHAAAVRRENVKRRAKWEGVEVEECDGCGYVVPSSHVRTISMCNGSDERQCKSCREFAAQCAHFFADLMP